MRTRPSRRAPRTWRGLAAACTLVWLAASCGSDSRAVEVATATGVADLSYVIPAGTGARIDRGEQVDIVPQDLRVHVGDVIRIQNDDDRGHLVGPFFVGAGETLTQQFRNVGQIAGGCSVHPSGTLTVTVLP